MREAWATFPVPLPRKFSRSFDRLLRLVPARTGRGENSLGESGPSINYALHKIVARSETGVFVD